MRPGSSRIFDPIHLEGTATDAVHLARYSNAAVTIFIDKLKVIDNAVEDPISNNNTRKLNCPSFSFVS